MIFCPIQRSKLFHFCEVKSQKCLPVDPKILKQKLFQLRPIRAG